jgi:60 kDa SS-A/Ro ribonucleoprotein
MQLVEILGAIEQVEPKFLAQAAIYARQKGHMKDVPSGESMPKINLNY